MWKCNRGHRFDSLPSFLLLYVLQCNRVSKNSDELKLAADPNEKCSGPKYEKLVTYSYISLAVYGVGIPLLFSVILFRHRWVVEMCFPLPVYHRLLCSFPPLARCRASFLVCLLSSVGLLAYCRFMIIADQRLRVANMSDTLNTNPYYFLQKRFKRLYFKFQPKRYYW
jgi:hypothetical protein